MSEKNSDARAEHTLALEDEIRLFIRAGKARFNPIKRHLDAGADPNAPAARGGQSIMEMALDHQFPISIERRFELLPLLIQHGGNPLNHPSLLAGLLEELHADHLIIQALSEREAQGFPCRSKDGGNILHLMAPMQSQVRGVHELLRQEHEGPKIPASWVREITHDGDNLIHCLWGQSKHMPEVAYEFACTLTLLDVGVDALAKNKAGKSGLDYIKQRLQHIQLSEGGEAFMAHIEALEIQQDTHSLSLPVRSRRI
jgi:hypothetical protein